MAKKKANNPKYPKKPTTKKPVWSSKKKSKKVAITPTYDSMVVFESTDGKFYSDQDCTNPTDSVVTLVGSGWEIKHEFNNETGYPGLHKQYIMRRRNTEGEEPIPYIGIG